MANICLILGKTGTGKSTSIKNLNPDTTAIINVLGKPLPFKGSNAAYNIERMNIMQAYDHASIITAIHDISTTATHIKDLIIDDATYIMRKENFNKATSKGYDKFVEMAVHFQKIIETAEQARKDLNIYIMMHTEDVVSNGSIVEQKVSTVGKMLESQYNIPEVVTVTLISNCSFNEKGDATYSFITKRCMIDGVLYPAKSPDGMFEETFIPNDLSLVSQKMEEYYG